jgi:hypothetical protein
MLRGNSIVRIFGSFLRGQGIHDVRLVIFLYGRLWYRTYDTPVREVFVVRYGRYLPR